jgi:hypothetical protein
MQHIAHRIAPAIFNHYQALFAQNSPPSIKKQLHLTIHDASKFCAHLFNLKKPVLKANQSIYLKKEYKFSTALHRENTFEIDRLSQLKSIKYGLLSKYCRYAQDIQKLERIKNLSKSQQNDLAQLTAKLKSCHPDYLAKIQKGLREVNPKTHVYYRQKSLEYAIYSKCHHMQLHSNTCLKDKRKKLYQIVRKDWAVAARHAYWPRLLGGSTHITGVILSLVSTITANTPIGIAAHFLMGFSRIASDFIMGQNRLQFKAFEESNCNYIVFRPSGILETGKDRDLSYHHFKKNIQTVSPIDHPNLFKLIHTKNHDLKIARHLSSQLSREEIELAKIIKQDLLELRAARGREKIESSGSAAQLRNNLGLGSVQLLLNIFKFIPDFHTQIALSALGVGSAIMQHTLNYFMAPSDFCRKMEQNCITQLNLSQGDVNDKITFQASLRHLEKSIKLNNLSHDEGNDLINHPDFFGLQSMTSSTKDFNKSANQALQYRLKNLIEYQENCLISKKVKISKQQEKIKSLRDAFEKTTAASNQSSESDLKKQLIISQRNHQDPINQKLAKRIIALEKSMAHLEADFKDLTNDFICLNTLKQEKDLQKIEAAVSCIIHHDLKEALADGQKATELIVKGKKMLKGERFRYLTSYIAPSLLSATLLTPLLISPIILGAETGAGKTIKGVNSCVVNLIASAQQISTGSNNALRDEYKARLKEDDDKSFKIQTRAKFVATDSRHQNHITPDIQKKHSAADFKLALKCAVAPLVAPIQHRKIAKQIDRYGLAIDQVALPIAVY